MIERPSRVTLAVSEFRTSRQAHWKIGILVLGMNSTQSQHAGDGDAGADGRPAVVHPDAP